MVLITENLADLLFYIQPPTHVIKIYTCIKEAHDLVKLRVIVLKVTEFKMYISRISGMLYNSF